jgi:hypothetical protein
MRTKRFSLRIGLICSVLAFAVLLLLIHPSFMKVGGVASAQSGSGEREGTTPKSPPITSVSHPASRTSRKRSRPSRESVQSLEGTVWDVIDNDGDKSTYTFLPNGKVQCNTGGIIDKYCWNWKQYGNRVIMSFEDGRREGTIQGDKIIDGRGYNSYGRKWKWTAMKRTA